LTTHMPVMSLFFQRELSPGTMRSHSPCFDGI